MRAADNSDRRGGRGLRSLPAIIAAIAIGGCLSVAGQIDRNALRGDDEVAPAIPEADRYADGRVFLERAERLVKPSGDVDYQIVVDDVMFRRGDMYMYCDSAHFYDLTNSLEAFGNVRMEQGDTLFVYADRLIYTDSTAMAVLYAEESPKVRLINRDVTLYTDEFYYDLGIELGYYETGGELVDDKNRLTSIYGEYAPSTKDAVFRDDVHLTSLSRADTLNIWTDDLRYNTDTHIARLNAPSKITSADGVIFTDQGVYNTETSVADLYERSLVVTSTGRTLVGDTLFYDRNRGYGEAWGDIVLTDTVNKTRLKGDYGFYNELTDSAFVTGHAIATDYSSADSLSLHGDTLIAYRMPYKYFETVMIPMSQYIAEQEAAAAEQAAMLGLPELPEMPEQPEMPEDAVDEPVEETVEETVDDSAEDPAEDPADQAVDESTEEPVDSTLTFEPVGFERIEFDDIVPEDSTAVALAPEEELVPKSVERVDSTQAILAFPHVRFYRSDLQGVCDSMTYVKRDSIIYLDKDPLVWSGDRQIFGNRILVHVNDSTADRITLPDNGFTAEMIEEGFYNQMSGRNMVAYLEEGALRHLDVSGNVQIVFFPINEEDSTYTKVANAESSFLAADFKNQAIERLKMWAESNETITPLYLAKKSLFFLNGFRWESWRRPSGHDDLLTIPVDPATIAKDPEPSETIETSESSENSENSESSESSEASESSDTTAINEEPLYEGPEERD